MTPKKICNINSQNQLNHHNDEGLTLRSGRRGVYPGRGQGSLAAATAAGGRPPSPATAYRPRQTRPENLPWQRRTTHLIEIKYCEETRPEQQLQAAHAQHDHLRRSIAGDHVLHVILLGVGGITYIPHTLVPLKILGFDSQRLFERVKKLALKLMLILRTMLISLFRPDILLTFKPIRRGLLACLPATLLILTDRPFLFW